MGMSVRGIRVPVAECLGDQIMGNSRNVQGKLVEMFFKFNSKAH